MTFKLESTAESEARCAQSGFRKHYGQHVSMKEELGTRLQRIQAQGSSTSREGARGVRRVIRA